MESYTRIEAFQDVMVDAAYMDADSHSREPTGNIRSTSRAFVPQLAFLFSRSGADKLFTAVGVSIVGLTQHFLSYCMQRTHRT